MINPTNFFNIVPIKSCNTRLNNRYMSYLLSFTSKDTFERQSFDISQNLKNIELGERINDGLDADVYYTNFDGYVMRVLKGAEFNPGKLEMLDNPDGIILASDKEDTMRLMKFVKGEPLYGKGWDINYPVTKDKYMENFNKIVNLPDKAFSGYMNDIVNIRKSGYEIDNTNPNNFLLDGNHINIVDLEKREVEPKLVPEDLYPLINYHHLPSVLQDMTNDEIRNFSDNIKVFYDRLVAIADKNNLKLEIPEIDHNKIQRRDVYLYHKDWKYLNLVAHTNMS